MMSGDFCRRGVIGAHPAPMVRKMGLENGKKIMLI